VRLKENFFKKNMGEREGEGVGGRINKKKGMGVGEGVRGRVKN
jgi:hypothetical protein